MGYYPQQQPPPGAYYQQGPPPQGYYQQPVEQKSGSDNVCMAILGTCALCCCLDAIF
ncbi:hypothetical protein NEUTE1DRAFT_116396 [Neurospora tetrasperma FGSC 2508]|uniref:Cysteine-rich transmembrane domain-containing protein n=1 Tax=Neurospora tetrasperma (strain FGSC 2508 / ATCC MYA-4615 / P0657) TaxID=510951 RepID=F8MJB1_NEUT8|nr:uncharacterized protein NEUTE1DRAFT_116396 [Neurospora tetrasperma FGSC 2508]EGO59108.1 hypothetical protein NEUTE1DRAFT_116396 [Neurospora tetrasperma FGSC 2508]EGZ73214.1 hypothetical protein NEUTE2DRAFT_107512 [Neurospora tetrasperma FGSC 2509]